MDKITEDILNQFQDFINYRFNKPEILLQALTTSQFANENKISSYQILETLGDAVIKLIISLKLYSIGEIDPGNLTKAKLRLEDNQTFHKIAMGMELWKYIFSSKKQRVKDSSILADVFEAICGAIFIDSGNNLQVVERIIIDRFITEWESLMKESPHLYKNQLLEYLQNKFKTTPTIKYDFEKLGPDNDARWIAKNPVIVDINQKELIKVPNNLKSKRFKTKIEAEKNISLKILKYLEGI
ncbi:MAG: ribonuclease III domain-containing protein [Promethearchaeota archaeon]